MTIVVMGSVVTLIGDCAASVVESFCVMGVVLPLPIMVGIAENNGQAC